MPKHNLTPSNNESSKYSQKQIRIDQAERNVFTELLSIGLMLLRAFVAGVASGMRESRCREVVVCSSGVTNCVGNCTDRSLGRCRFCVGCTHRARRRRSSTLRPNCAVRSAAWRNSYVMEDWQQRLCVKETFAEGVEKLAAILGIKASVETAEEMNLRMAEYAESFRIQQPAPPAGTEEAILVATADGTSVPMHCADRTTAPSAEAGTRKGSTRRAYVGAVYSIEPFVREPQDVLDELFRKQVATRRPRPQGKRLWAEMAAREGILTFGSEFVFIEMAIDVQTRDPDRQRTLVCLMDGEQKLWTCNVSGWAARWNSSIYSIRWSESVRSRRLFSRKTNRGGRRGSATNWATY